MTEYICDGCAKVYKSRSGLWKHEKKCAALNDDIIGSSTEEPLSESATDESKGESPPMTSTLNSPEDDDSVVDTDDEWMDFQLGDDDETDTIPAALKMIVATAPSKKKKSAKEIKALRDTEVAMLKMALSGIDVLLTTYGRGVTLNDDFLVQHGDKSKSLVAFAQYEWLDEKGFHITKYASKGMVAASLTGWYVGAPLMRIKQEAKKPMIRKIGGGIWAWLGRLPLIGRIFKRKQHKQDDEAFTGVESDELV